jgi:undecaprenyl diphosphate synthase
VPVRDRQYFESRKSEHCRGRNRRAPASRGDHHGRQAAADLNISYLTIYSFSSENWSRPAEEVSELMTLMKRFIRQDLAELHQNNVRIRVIGERQSVDAELMALIDEACELTALNTSLTLVIAFNYGSRNEIAAAARRLGERVEAGQLEAAAITSDALAGELDTAGMPDPELLIRTSGELRISNFLLWQLAYTEFVFIDAYWPEFSREHLEGAIAEYRARDRRFGGLSKRSSA